MLAQPFSFGVLRGTTAKKADSSSYTNNYHGLKLHNYVDLTGKRFMYDCDDVFRLSMKYDFGKEYQYEIHLSLPTDRDNSLPNNALLVKSRSRKSNEQISGMRFVTGPGASHESGEGNFPHPVIYLGLNRLWPLAVSKKCSFTSDPLSGEDREWYVKKYNEILCLDEHNNNAKFMNTSEKSKFITPESTSYDGESCSAGQDNLSQLLTAILSFRSLKKKLGNKYQGGLLLIDELDATLHAFAQDKLLAALCDAAEDLNLQIVATTHSLRLFEKAYQSHLKKNIEVLYLANSDGLVIQKDFTSYEEISDHLKVESTIPQNRDKRKVTVVFEDEEAKNLFRQIVGNKLSKYICVAEVGSISSGYLKSLADMSKKLPELKEMVFLPDGDMAKQWTRSPDNLLALPGEERPETLIYKHLFSMTEADPFWGKICSTYTRQFAIISRGGNSKAQGDDKAWVKRWYTQQSHYWGRGNAKVFKSWVNANKNECLEFCKKFLRLIKGRYKGEIPKEVIEKILAPFK